MILILSLKHYVQILIYQTDEQDDFANQHTTKQNNLERRTFIFSLHFIYLIQLSTKRIIQKTLSSFSP